MVVVRPSVRSLWLASLPRGAFAPTEAAPATERESGGRLGVALISSAESADSARDSWPFHRARHGETVRRAPDRHPPSRLIRPYHRQERATCRAGSPRVRGLLPRSAPSGASDATARRRTTLAAVKGTSIAGFRSSAASIIGIHLDRPRALHRRRNGVPRERRLEFFAPNSGSSRRTRRR